MDLKKQKWTYSLSEQDVAVLILILLYNVMININRNWKNDSRIQEGHDEDMKSYESCK